MLLFTQLSILVVIALLIAIAMRLLRQPLIIGHIVTGLVAAPFLAGLIATQETLALFSEFGIAFLLFIVGIHLNPRVIREIGRVAFITGVGQVLITTLVGFAVARLLGIPVVTALYLGVALSFSSTIIILKLLSDKGDLSKLYARISIGFLLVQDLIAILLLFLIPILARSGESSAQMIVLFLTGLLFAGIVLSSSHLFLPRLDKFLAGSRELLFLFAIGWGLGISALFRAFGFSLESGALIAGISLSTLSARHEISARLTPLRDFFIIVFFILLGSQMVLADLYSLILPGIILSLLILIGNPLILMAIMGALGYRKKTSLQTGFATAQISEFSLILVALGVSLGHVSGTALSLTTLIGLITIFISTYLILHSERIYAVLAPYIGMFERKKSAEKNEMPRQYEYVLFGYNRIGYDFREVFRRMRQRFLVVDYNPEVVERLSRQGVDVEYGDAGDLDYLQSLPLNTVEIAVTTIPEIDTNILITREVKRQSPRAIVLSVAHQISEALALYREGADFVILPHFLGGQYASMLVERLGNDRESFIRLKHDHIARLEERSREGHEHPLPERVRLTAK